MLREAQRQMPDSATATATLVREFPEGHRTESTFDDQQFVNLANVPVFAEHQTKTHDDRELRFGLSELQAVARRCNQRIRDTGDYSAVVLGHTPDPNDGGMVQQPELVGFAGPFRVGMIGAGQTRKYSILADFHIFREDFPRLKKFPRRSPELWLEDRYEDMFLDPISLLGAEAPRLDMGLLYSARRQADGRQVLKYAAACPSAGNVFVRSDDAKKEHYEANPEGEDQSMPLSPDDVRQIVDALEQLPWVQWCKTQMTADESPAAGMPGAEPAAAAPAGPDAAAAPTAAGASASAPAGPPPARPEEKKPEQNAAPPEPTTTTPAPPPPAATGEGGLGAVKYSRLEAELAELRRQTQEARQIAEAERGKRIDVERYARLTEKRRVKAFDIDAEHERCRYSKMNDAQFDAHLALIDANYRDIPIDTSLPIPDGTAKQPPAPAAPVKERYSKEVIDKATRYAKRLAMSGQSVDYAEVLEKAAAGQLTE